MAARDNVVDIVKRVIALDLFGRHDFGAGAAACLDFLAFPQVVRESFIVGQVHVAIALQDKFGNAWIVAHSRAEILDEIGAKLRDADVDLA